MNGRGPCAFPMRKWASREGTGHPSGPRMNAARTQRCSPGLCWGNAHLLPMAVLLNTFPTFITALLHLQMILRDRTSKEAPIPRLSSWVEMGIPHEGLCGEGQPARRWTEVAGIPVLSFPGCVTLL